MDQADFNFRLQEIQAIEGQVGYKILTLVKHYDKDGRLREAMWCNNDLRKVLWQSDPFTSKTRYGADEALCRKIMFADFTR